MEKIWKCKIGGNVGDMPAGADWPMRRAVQTAFETLTGVEASFTFSGWGATLTEVERAVHENRAPNCGAMQEAIDAGDGTLHGAIEYWQAESLRLRAELAEAKKFKDGMLDVLGGACPNDHRSTPFEEFKGCTPCLRAELAECKKDAERYRWVLEHWDTGGPDFGKIMFSSTAETLSADIDTARKGEGE